jgi:hypothetical protein
MDHRSAVRKSMPLVVTALLLALAAPPPTAAADAPPDDPRFEVELEVAPVWQSRNDVEIPNDGTATRFSLEELAGRGPWAAGRFYFTWNISPRHGFRLLLAPLSYTETGRFDEPVRFAGQDYLPGVATEATYEFNSWRATYRYKFKQGLRWNGWIGFTAKVRDAKIELQQGATRSRDTDFGFVPLIYVRGDYRFAPRWHLLLEGDLLGGGPGRALDLSVRLGRDFGERWALAFGYRTLEGGVDIDDVYNFAWFQYAVVSGTYRWGARD